MHDEEEKSEVYFAMATDNREAAVQCVALGRRALQERDYERAKRLAEKAIRLHPRWAEVCCKQRAHI